MAQLLSAGLFSSCDTVFNFESFDNYKSIIIVFELQAQHAKTNEENCSIF